VLDMIQKTEWHILRYSVYSIVSTHTRTHVRARARVRTHTHDWFGFVQTISTTI